MNFLKLPRENQKASSELKIDLESHNMGATLINTHKVGNQFDQKENGEVRQNKKGIKTARILSTIYLSNKN